MANKLAERISKFSEEQSREHRRRMSSSQFIGPRSAEEKDKGPIPLVPFQGLGEVEQATLPEYRTFIEYLRKKIAPSRNLEESVLNVMINMYLNLPNDVIQPNKGYNRREKNYTTEQLGVFMNALQVAEIYWTRMREYMGNFPNLKRFKGTSEEFVSSDLWKGEGKYHLVFIEDPVNIVDNWYNADELIFSIFKEKYRAEIEKLDTFFSDYTQGEHADLLRKIPGLEECKDDLSLVKGKIKLYLKKNPDLEPKKREIYKKTIDFIDLTDEAFMHGLEMTERFKNDNNIILRTATSITDNGILLLETKLEKKIPGFYLVSHDGNISTYQKR